MKKNNGLILLMALSFSCVKKATIALPKAEAKLVVACFISPDDSLISATVKLSTAKFGTGNGMATPINTDDVQNATVIISDGTNNLALDFDTDLFFYSANAKSFPVKSGNTYYLSVSTPDGKNVSSRTTVPQGQLSIESFSINYKTNTPTSLDYNYSLVVNDIPGETNYVGIYDQAKFVMGGNNITAPPDTMNSLSGFFDTDEKISKSKYYYDSNFNISASDSIHYFRINISVLNCSKEFYLYNQSTQKASSSAQNPFSDPVLVYTNITNGFGCFGSYVGNYMNKKVR
jgi:hypothetical protein